jgi:hypothetical protein
MHYTATKLLFARQQPQQHICNHYVVPTLNRRQLLLDKCLTAVLSAVVKSTMLIKRGDRLESPLRRVVYSEVRNESTVVSGPMSVDGKWSKGYHLAQNLHGAELAFSVTYYGESKEEACDAWDR